MQPLLGGREKGRPSHMRKISKVSLSSSMGALAKKFDLNLYIPRNEIERPQSPFPHSCVCERSIYSHDLSTYFPAAE
jgi:hypothetical protein